jgi:moderate conductance mechanosensitive channel
MNVVAQTPADDVIAACGDPAGSVCEWVYDATGNEVLADVADWLIGKPLTIVLVLACAWLASAIAKRWVTRVVRRMLLPPDAVLSRLESMGLASTAPDAVDRRRAARAGSLATALSSTLTVAIWIVAVMIIASVLGVQLAPLLAGAGILSVAIGFGSQSLVKDCINGMFMLIEDQYGIGDSVDVGEASGVVERITLRVTVLRGADGTVWHVPNGEILRVGNRTQLWSAAVVDVEVSHGADLTVAKRVLQETADRVCTEPEYADAVLEPPIVLGVESLLSTGITVRLTVKTRPGQQFALQRALREALMADLRANGVELAGRFIVPPGATPP